MPSLTIDLPANRATPRTARRLWELASGQWDVPVGDCTELLLTEVVTNAVVHAGTPVILRFAVAGSQLRVEVSDGSPLPPHPRAPHSGSENGRGLLLLDRLSSDWGWTQGEQSPARKTVWFEVECTDEDHVPLGDAFDVDSIEPL